MPDEVTVVDDIWRALAETCAPTDGRRAQAAIAFLAELAVETVKLRPERLLRQCDVERTIEALRTRHGAAPDPASVWSAMHALLALGIRCSPNDELLDGLSRLEIPGVPDDDAVECLIASLRPQAIEVRVEREYLEALLERDVEDPIELHSVSQAAERAQQMSEELFSELGVRLPPIRLIADETLPARACRVQLTHLAGPVMTLLPMDRVLVRVPPGDLSRADIPAQSARHPASGHMMSTVSVDSAAAVRGLGYDVLSPFLYLFLVLHLSIRRGVGRLVNCETVEYELSQLEQVFPQLVRGALMVVRVQQLTRVVRALVEEGVSVRNLRVILGRMASFAAVPAPIRGRVVLDDRLLLDERIGPSVANTLEARLQFVRIGLGPAIHFQCARGGPLRACLLASDLEDKLIKHLAFRGSGGALLLSPAQLDVLRDAVQDQIPLDTPVAIVTTASLRLTLRELLRDALPHLPVLAWEELPPRPSANIEEVKQIDVPDSCSADQGTTRSDPTRPSLVPG